MKFSTKILKSWVQLGFVRFRIDAGESLRKKYENSSCNILKNVIDKTARIEFFLQDSSVKQILNMCETFHDKSQGIFSLKRRGIRIEWQSNQYNDSFLEICGTMQENFAEQVRLLDRRTNAWNGAETQTWYLWRNTMYGTSVPAKPCIYSSSWCVSVSEENLSGIRIISCTRIKARKKDTLYLARWLVWYSTHSFTCSMTTSESFNFEFFKLWYRNKFTMKSNATFTS